jgi:CheY-like chemotaxis protein
MSEPVILAIDDDPQVLAALRRDLKTHYQADYRVLAASSGEAALSTVRELKTRGDSLSIVISDQRMPAMLGVDLLAKCRELYPIAKRVLLTAYSDIKAAVKAINEARLDYYLEKPWDPPEERLFPPSMIFFRRGRRNSVRRLRACVWLGTHGLPGRMRSRTFWEATSFRIAGWSPAAIRKPGSCRMLPESLPTNCPLCFWKAGSSCAMQIRRRWPKNSA